MTTTNNDKLLAPDVWQQLLLKIEYEQSPYLKKQEFHVHSDAFARLYNEESDIDVPFAMYEMLPMRDDSLSISMLFFRFYFDVCIGPMRYSVHYESASFSATQVHYSGGTHLKQQVSAEKIADTILLILKLSLNGQIACVASYYNGRYLAAEMYILGYKRQPFPWQIIGKFPRYVRTSNNYRIFQNDYIRKHYSVPDDFPLLPAAIDGVTAQYGRTIRSLDDIKPLSKKIFNELTENIQLQQSIGKPPARSVFSVYNTSATYWIHVLLFNIALLYLLRRVPYQFSHSNWIEALIFVASIILAVGTTAIIMNIRQAKQRYGVVTTGSRFDDSCKKLGESFTHSLNKIGKQRLLLLLHQLTLLTLSLVVPSWQPRNVSPRLLSGLQMVHYTPIILLLFGWNLIAILILCLNWHKQSKFLNRVILSIVATYPIVMLTYNSVFTVSDDKALMPESLFFILYLLLTLASVFIPFVALAVSKYIKVVKSRQVPQLQ
jgi:hypothetical protein